MTTKTKQNTLKSLMRKHGLYYVRDVDFTQTVNIDPDQKNTVPLDEIRVKSINFVNVLKQVNDNSILDNNNEIVVGETTVYIGDNQYSPFVFLDIANTNLSENEILDIFTRLHIPVVIYNCGNPTFFRVVCFVFNHMNSQQYSTIIDQLVQQVYFTIITSPEFNNDEVRLQIDHNQSKLNKWFQLPYSVYCRPNETIIKSNFKTEQDIHDMLGQNTIFSDLDLHS